MGVQADYSAEITKRYTGVGARFQSSTVINRIIESGPELISTGSIATEGTEDDTCIIGDSGRLLGIIVGINLVRDDE